MPSERSKTKSGQSFEVLGPPAPQLFMQRKKAGELIILCDPVGMDQTVGKYHRSLCPVPFLGAPPLLWGGGVLGVQMSQQPSQDSPFASLIWESLIAMTWEDTTPKITLSSLGAT